MKLKKYTLDQLIEAVKTSFSIRQVLSKLNIAEAGGSYQTFYRLKSFYNLDTSHFTGQLWSKDRIIGPQRPIEDYLNNKASTISSSLRKRLLKEKIFKHECSSCGLKEWLNKPIPLELDHIDGNNADNSLNNLRLLCPNCHSLTPTYRGKNIGKNKDRILKTTRPGISNKPDKEILEKLLLEKSGTKIAKELGVSKSSVFGWAKSYNLILPPKGYWKKK